MRKVFVPTLPTRYDQATGNRVPLFDLNPAVKFGQLEVIITETGMPTNQGLTIVKNKIKKMESSDYLLAIGDIIFIAAAICYACEKNEMVRVLRWDKQRHEYNCVEVYL